MAALALQKYVRGDCTRCEQVSASRPLAPPCPPPPPPPQVHVLGWATRADAFECCACHDAHDEDENSFSYSYDGCVMAV